MTTKKKKLYNFDTWGYFHFSAILICYFFMFSLLAGEQLQFAIIIAPKEALFMQECNGYTCHCLPVLRSRVRFRSPFCCGN
jgi:hypothetical protein